MSTTSPLPAKRRTIRRADPLRLAASASAVAAALGFASAAWAGPPFTTDDPVPTETGHWEIYGPLVEGEGRGRDFSGDTGIELNYGAAKDVQLTMGLHADFAHDAQGWRWGLGDLDLSAKYRLINNEHSGFQLAVFPAITLPTATNGTGAGRVTGFLPVWAQQDFGPWSVFGGGGYNINPGPGNRNYWSTGIAVNRELGEKLTLGIEVDRQGSSAAGQPASTSLGAGLIAALGGPFSVIVSGGPKFEDGVPGAGFHGYAAIGMDY